MKIKIKRYEMAQETENYILSFRFDCAVGGYSMYLNPLRSI